jgi:hypothetical protein
MWYGLSFIMLLREGKFQGLLLVSSFDSGGKFMGHKNSM